MDASRATSLQIHFDLWFGQRHRKIGTEKSDSLKVMANLPGSVRRRQEDNGEESDLRQA